MPIPDPRSLRRALENYPRVIERQGVERLPALDRWYTQDLPEQIASRDPARITLPELVKLTEWKMARGVWRAPNLVLVRGNDPAAVEEISSVALSKIPHPTAPVAELAKLRGVGAATASAVAAAAAPEIYPFFDELVAAQVPGLGKLAWTTSYYSRYAEALRAAAEEAGDDWTPEALQRALWAHVGGKAGAAAT